MKRQSQDHGEAEQGGLEVEAIVQRPGGKDPFYVLSLQGFAIPESKLWDPAATVGHLG